MISLTLTYSGTEKFLADWGYADPQLKLVYTLDAPSTFTCRAPGQDPAAAEDIPNYGIVTIRAGRAFGGGVFSGGSIIFVGRRTDYGRVASPTGPGTSRVFSDPWYDLQKITFQHYWKEWNGSAFVNFYFSRLNLFQDITAGPGVPWTYLTTYGQILEIISFAASPGNANLQAGTIDPTWTVPSYGVKAISCAEALELCCRPMADVVKYFDYTTTPPTLNIRQRASLGATTLPYAGTSGNRSHISSQIKSRPDLVPPCVSIQYLTNNVVDDKTYPAFTTDTYPTAGSPSPTQIDALVIPIDLRGSNRTNVKGQVVAAACDPTTIAFWQAHKKGLLDTTRVTDLAIVNTAIEDSSLQCITIRDAHNPATVISLSDFPNEITKGDVASWMKDGSGTAITAQEVTITGWLSYKVLNPKDLTNTLHVAQAHQINCTLKLTNSAVGTIKYSALKTYTPGDPSITGLAQNIYTSLAQLQWEGEHEILDAELADGIVSPALNLNLSGGATAWATMAAAVASVDVDFVNGRQTISFGPHKHLSAAQLVEYMLMWRYRQVYDNPSLRSNGQTDSSNDVQIPEDQPVKDTTEIHPNLGQHTITSAQTDTTGLADAQINLDASLIANNAGLMGTGSGLTPAQRVLKPSKLQYCVNGSLLKIVAIAGPTQTA